MCCLDKRFFALEELLADEKVKNLTWDSVRRRLFGNVLVGPAWTSANYRGFLLKKSSGIGWLRNCVGVLAVKSKFLCNFIKNFNFVERKLEKIYKIFEKFAFRNYFYTFFWKKKNFWKNFRENLWKMRKNARAKLCKNDEAAVSGLTLFPPNYIVFKMPLPGHSVGVIRHAHPPQIFFFQKKIFQKKFFKKIFTEWSRDRR